MERVIICPPSSLYDFVKPLEGRHEWEQGRYARQGRQEREEENMTNLIEYRNLILPLLTSLLVHKKFQTIVYAHPSLL